MGKQIGEGVAGWESKARGGTGALCRGEEAGRKGGGGRRRSRRGRGGEVGGDGGATKALVLEIDVLVVVVVAVVVVVVVIQGWQRKGNEFQSHARKRIISRVQFRDFCI